MLSIIGGFISASTVPILILNLFAGIVGGIWLLTIGEWKLVILALIIGYSFPYAYSLLMIITIPLQRLIDYLVERKQKAIYLFLGYINMLISDAVMILWVFMVFVYFVASASSQERMIFPYVLFGWQIALGPFQYMASKEPPDNLGSYFAVYLASICYATLLLFYYSGLWPFVLPVIIIFILIKEGSLLWLSTHLS